MSPAFEAMLNRSWMAELRAQNVSLETVAEVLARVVAAAPEPVPRVDIADGTMLAGAPKLPRGSVSRASSVLLKLKMLQAQDAVSARPGRPIVPLRLSRHWTLAGVQVSDPAGQPPAAVGVLISLDGSPVGEKITQAVRQPLSEASLLDAVTAVVEQLRTRTKSSTLLGLGVGLGGRIFTGLAASRNLSLLCDALSHRLNMPTVIENGVDAQAVREVWRRDPASKRQRFPQPHFAVVGLYRDSVSSALVINRKVYRGDHDLAGGVGHLTVDYRTPLPVSPAQTGARGFYAPCSCGRGFGHLETLATPDRIAGQTGLPFEQAARQPLDRRSPVTAAFRTGGEALGRGISAMLDIANPGQILLLLPESLARAEKGTAAAAYESALRSAVDRYSYSAALDGAVSRPTLIMDEIDPDGSVSAAQAAAACVLDSFIAYARGEQAVTP